MIRPSSSTFITLLAIALVGCMGSDKSTTERDRNPNIIWLMAEDISLDLECYGMKAVKTPNLNELAKEGRMYTNCFVTNSICSPSRSAMMVGSHQLKINAHNHRSNRQIPLPNPYKPFTYWLRHNGYTTILGHHAVFHKGMKTDVNFKSTSFGDWDGVENFGLFDKKHEFTAEDQPFFAQVQLKVTHRGEWWQDIRDKSESPIHPDSVELPPYYADDPIIRMDWARYLDQIEYMDYEVGLIRQELEEKGLAENTVIIFIGDNGRCNIRGKGYLHDPGLRIPLIVYYPEKLSDGKTDDRLISATDITATILDIAGVTIPDYMTGSSFLQEDFSREEIFATRDYWDEIGDKSRSITDGKIKYIRNDNWDIPYDAHQAYLEFYRPAVHVMRDLQDRNQLNESQALFFSETKPVEELYDLESDPHELNNLALNTQYYEKLSVWRSKLAKEEMDNKPVSDIMEIVHPASVDVLTWLQNERSDLIERMKKGEEIGFSTYAKEYKKLNR